MENQEITFAQLVVIIFFLIVLAEAAGADQTGSFTLSGTVPDLGYKIENGQVVPLPDSQLKVEVKNNTITVRSL